MATYKVGYLIGSLAKASINRKLAQVLVNLAPPELAMTEISFKDRPLKNAIDWASSLLPLSAPHPEQSASPSRSRACAAYSASATRR